MTPILMAILSVHKSTWKNIFAVIHSLKYDKRVQNWKGVHFFSFSSHFAEIRQLDGEMKQLVYENFEKFIGAAETIRSVTI